VLNGDPQVCDKMKVVFFAELQGFARATDHSRGRSQRTDLAAAIATCCWPTCEATFKARNTLTQFTGVEMTGTAKRSWMWLVPASSPQIALSGNMPPKSGELSLANSRKGQRIEDSGAPLNCDQDLTSISPHQCIL